MKSKIMSAFFCYVFMGISFEMNFTNDFDECERWAQKHVYFAEDVHFYNKTFPFVKIDSFGDLNVTTQCSPRDYDVNSLKILANTNILFDNDLDMRVLLNIFNSSHIQDFLWFKNIKGFNENSREITAEKDAILSQTYNFVRAFQFSNIIFDFYRRGVLLKTDDCKRENFDSKTQFFGRLKVMTLIGNVFYNNKICPYVFMNTKLESLDLFEISNSLLFKNRPEFLIINETNIESNLNFLHLGIYIDSLTLTNLNPFAFKKLKFLAIQGNLEQFDENLFENFREIRYISLRSDDLVNFFHRGTKWLNSINKNLSVSLSSIHNLEFTKNIHRLVSVEFDVQYWLFFNRFYAFPNEDICLFKNFPHSQLVLPLIVFDLKNYYPNEWSCTLVWLMKYYHLYFSSDFQESNSYVNLEPAYRAFFKNQSITHCNPSEFHKTYDSCNFSQRFTNCDFKAQLKRVPLNGFESLISILKWSQYIIEVYLRTILCFIGLVTNLLILKVIRTKKSAKNFSSSLYKHIFANALFNVGYCFIYMFSLLNICIYPKTSFCSSVWQTEFAQYFYIYVILFLGNTLRLCCNISYIFFALSRIALMGASNTSKLKKYFETQNIKRFYMLVSLVSMGFSLFLVFENKVNTLYQDYVGLNLGDFRQNNAYDVKYCESFRSELMTGNIQFSLTSSFLLKCELFKWFNLINNILNNGLFLVISISVDIFMVRFSNRVIEKKKALNSPHLNEAIAFKTKLNKMIIINGTLYFFSHFPEFIVTVIFYLFKSDSITTFCYMTFDCTTIIEMAQAFHFLSIGFQFFIFLKFDHNFEINFRFWKVK